MVNNETLIIVIGSKDYLNVSIAVKMIPVNYINYVYGKNSRFFLIIMKYTGYTKCTISLSVSIILGGLKRSTARHCETMM